MLYARAAQPSGSGRNLFVKAIYSQTCSQSAGTSCVCVRRTCGGARRANAQTFFPPTPRRNSYLIILDKTYGFKYKNTAALLTELFGFRVRKGRPKLVNTQLRTRHWIAPQWPVCAPCVPCPAAGAPNLFHSSSWSSFTAPLPASASAARSASASLVVSASGPCPNRCSGSRAPRAPPTPRGTAAPA